MNQATKDHIKKAMNQNIRYDGRKNNEYREVSIEYGVSSTAEGSARVRFGDCEVIAGVKLSVGTPFADTPDEGVLMVSAEMLQIANEKFEGGQPGIDAIELARVIDSGVRESHMINNEKLSITSGEKVWMVSVDICPVNANGNLFDISALAAVAALQDACFPEMVNGKPDYHKKTNEKLPIDTVPISITIYKFGNHLVVDPTEEEIDAADARLTMAFVEDDQLVALQKGGEAPFDPKEIDEIIELGKKKARELRALL